MTYIESVHHPHDVWIEHFSEIEDRWHKGKELAISSLPELDNKIWGLRKKKLVVVGARPSMGKSTFMLQIAWDFVLQGKKVYFFTLEMTKEECLERLFCIDQRVDNFILHTGKITEMQHLPDIQRKIEDFNKNINTDKLIFIESYGKTFREINEVVDGIGDAEVVILDYIQMIKEKTTSKEAIDEYIKDLRNYAIRKNFCAIIGSQINRGTFDGKKITFPELHELKGSGCLEEVCDLAFLLHWHYFYTREDAIKKDYWVRVAKNRGGRTGVFNCLFEPEFYQIKEKPCQNGM